MASVWVILFTILLILFIEKLLSQQNKINTVSIQGLEGHKMTKQLLVKTEWQIRQLSSVIFSGLEEEFWSQLKLNGKITTLFYCADGFSFWEKMYNFGKICISRPLGMTPVTGTWLTRKKITRYMKVLKVKPVYQQMSLFPKLGMVEISTHRHFRPPLLIQMFINVASFPRLSGIGMSSPILLSHLLKLQRIVFLNSLLWWELGTNFPNHRSWWMVVVSSQVLVIGRTGSLITSLSPTIICYWS